MTTKASTSGSSPEIAPDVSELVSALTDLKAKATGSGEAETAVAVSEGEDAEAGPVSGSPKPGVPGPPRSSSKAEERLAKRKYRKLTAAEWLQVKVLWEFGIVTMDDLSVRFGPSVESIRAKIRSEGWVRGSRAHELAEATASSIKGEAAKNVERISAMKEEYLRYSKAISTLTMREISQAVAKGPGSLAGLKDTMTALQKASAIISTMRDEHYYLFGLYDNEDAGEEIPELGMTEYSPDEIAQLQRDMGDVEQTLKNATGTEEDGAGAMPDFEE